MNYQSIGSGGGIKQILAKTVDFGATDAPLEPAQLEKEGLIQFPMVIGGVVPVFNIEGIKPGGLNMTGALIADIYLGKVSKWNAPEIVALNKGVKLPNQDITVVARSDGSGTTFIRTKCRTCICRIVTAIMLTRMTVPSELQRPMRSGTRRQASTRS